MSSSDDSVRMMTAPAPTPAYQDENVAKLQRVSFVIDLVLSMLSNLASAIGFVIVLLIITYFFLQTSL